MFDETTVWVPELFNTEPNEADCIYMYAQGDINNPISAVMPKDGFCSDALIRHNNIGPDDRHPEDNAEEFGQLTSEEINHLKTQNNS